MFSKFQCVSLSSFCFISFFFQSAISAEVLDPMSYTFIYYHMQHWLSNKLNPYDWGFIFQSNLMLPVKTSQPRPSQEFIKGSKVMVKNIFLEIGLILFCRQLLLLCCFIYLKRVYLNDIVVIYKP